MMNILRHILYFSLNILIAIVLLGILAIILWYFPDPIYP